MSRSRILAAALAAAALSCADPEEQFRAGRLLDACDRTWPVCTSTAGCIVNDAQYLEGRFPGTRRFVVRTQGQAEIAVVLYLRSQAATGNETRIEWNEAGCGTKAVSAADGKAFFKEFEALGEYRRVEKVYREGDHLLEVSSDSTAEYLLKVEIRSLEHQ